MVDTTINKGGAPIGNQNAVRGRQATHALELALKVKDGELEIDNLASGMKTLVTLWLKQINDAMDDGDANKMKLITERLDGRPRQAVDVGGQNDNPLVTEIRRKIVKSGD